MLAFLIVYYSWKNKEIKIAGDIVNQNARHYFAV